MGDVRGDVVEPQASDEGHPPSPHDQAAPDAGKQNPSAARPMSAPGAEEQRLQHVAPQPKQLQSLSPAIPAVVPLNGHARQVHNGSDDGRFPEVPGQASWQGQPWQGQQSGQQPLPESMHAQPEAPGSTQMLPEQVSSCLGIEH